MVSTSNDRADENRESEAELEYEAGEKRTNG